MSEHRVVLLSLAAVGVAAALAMPTAAWAQGKPDCTVVLSKLHRGASHGHTPDVEKIARKLGVDESWVERCAEAYGRQLKKRKPKAGEPSEQFTERDEQEFLEELSREEKETIGDTYFTTIDNDFDDRRKLRKARDEDTVNEWEPMETHEWNPHEGHMWRPFLHDDDLGDGN